MLQILDDARSSAVFFHLTGDEALFQLSSYSHGLSQQEAESRFEQYGRNALPRSMPPSLLWVFLRQFASPLIYVLGAAALVSLLIQELSDAGFIAAVLLVNAIIGTIQEFSAQQAADALQQLVKTNTRVMRGGDAFELDAEELVPGGGAG